MPGETPRLIKALLRQPCDTTPVWIMRQAGRYLPEYRAVREHVRGFLNLCKTPELACEVTMQPVRRFDLDAAIIFSDILIVPEAMGMDLRFVENHGPQFPEPLRDDADIKNLRPVDESSFDFLSRAVALTVNSLKPSKPLIGFAGSPWTLATYMIEGRGGRFRRIKTMMRDRPEWLADLLERLSGAVVECLRVQLNAGARCAMLFDSWGGILGGAHYRQFSLAPLKRIAKTLRETHDAPLILFTRGGGLWLEDMADAGYDALGLDWMCDIADARRRVGERVALQGNLDPAALFASPEALRREVRAIIENYGPGTGHVFNLGHGIEPQTDPDQVAALIDAVREFGGIAADARA